MEWPAWWNSIPDTISFQTLSSCSHTKISTGIPFLDNKIGGLIAGSIYELSGEAGTGKTNLCLQISTSVSSYSQVYYLSTQKPLSHSRLSSIHLNSSNFIQKYSPDLQTSILSITEELPKLALNNLKLFILDNIYTLVQSEDLEGKNKFSLLQRLAIIIKYLATQYNFAVIIVNNVVNVNGNVMPGLGINWSYCINHRFFLSKNENGRKLKVLFSITGQWECEVLINNENVELIGEIESLNV